MMQRVLSFELSNTAPDLPHLYILLSEGKLLGAASGVLALLSPEQLQRLMLDVAEARFLGVANNSHACFVLTLAAEPEIPGHGWVSPRSLMGNFASAEYDLVSRALQVQQWARDHAFCGRCGSPMQLHATERAMFCSPCGRLDFPRISPCIITVVTRDDHCLLAHHTRYASAFYSCLAGFVEAGESLEAALRREVMEEVGIEVGALEYFGSQSWPFPGQMMVGFLADYVAGDIRIDADEIADARWFRYDALPDIPGEVSISGQLIREFVRRCQARYG